MHKKYFDSAMFWFVSTNTHKYTLCECGYKYGFVSIVFWLAVGFPLVNKFVTTTTLHFKGSNFLKTHQKFIITFPTFCIVRCKHERVNNVIFLFGIYPVFPTPFWPQWKDCIPCINMNMTLTTLHYFISSECLSLQQ